MFFFSWEAHIHKWRCYWAVSGRVQGLGPAPELPGLTALGPSSPQGPVCLSQDPVGEEQGSCLLGPSLLPAHQIHGIMAAFSPVPPCRCGAQAGSDLTRASQVWDPQVGPYPLLTPAAGEACGPWSCPAVTVKLSSTPHTHTTEKLLRFLSCRKV